MRKKERLLALIEEYENGQIDKENLVDEMLKPATKKSHRPFKRGDAFEMHKATIEKFAPELMQAENTIERIRNDKEWIRAYNYFHVLYTRGRMLERLTHDNGYAILMKEGE